MLAPHLPLRIIGVVLMIITCVCHAAAPTRPSTVPLSEDARLARAKEVLREASGLSLERRSTDYELVGLCALVGDIDTALALAELRSAKGRPVAYRCAITGLAAHGEIDRAKELLAQLITGDALQARLAKEAIAKIEQAQGAGATPGRLYSLAIYGRIRPPFVRFPPRRAATRPVTEQELSLAKGTRRVQLLEAEALRLHAAGNVEEARRHFGRALDAVADEKNTYAAVHLFQDLGLSMAQCGFMDLSRNAFDRAVQLALATPDLDRGMASELGLDPARAPRLSEIGFNDIVLGGIAKDRAIAGDLSGALATVGQIRDGRLRHNAMAEVATVLALQGKPNQAADLLRPLPDADDAWTWLEVLKAHLAQGNINAARTIAEGMRTSYQHWAYYHVAYAWAASGDVDGCMTWVRGNPNRDVRVGALIGVAQALLGVVHSSDLS